MAQRASFLWFLLPVFLSLIGGIVGYFILKPKDETRANQVFLVGFFLFFITFGLGLLIGYDPLGLITPLSLLN